MNSIEEWLIIHGLHQYPADPLVLGNQLKCLQLTIYVLGEKARKSSANLSMGACYYHYRCNAITPLASPDRSDTTTTPPTSTPLLTTKVKVKFLVSLGVRLLSESFPKGS
jgi:hypothetical protein